MRHEFAHDLELELAIAAARAAARAYARHLSSHELTLIWVEQTRVEISFRVGNRNVDGSVTVMENKYIFTVDVPKALKVFSRPARKLLDRETRVWVEKARSGNLDSDNGPIEDASPVAQSPD